MNQYPAWTPEQLAIVKENVGKLTAAQIGALVGRNAQAIRDVMKRKLQLKCNPAVSYNKWTEDQLAILRENAGKLSAVKIGRMIGMNHSSVSEKIRALGLNGIPKTKKHIWTDSELEKLKLLSAGSTIEEVAREIGVCRSAVCDKSRQLGIKVISARHWREHEDALLREMSGHATMAQIGKQLGRSRVAVSKRAIRLGLSIPRISAARAPRVRGLRQAKPKAPRLIRVIERVVDICPLHHCPVSNWAEHKERLACAVIPPYLRAWYEKQRGEAA
jgi:biotin operon repressor